MAESPETIKACNCLRLKLLVNGQDGQEDEILEFNSISSTLDMFGKPTYLFVILGINVYLWWDAEIEYWVFTLEEPHQPYTEALIKGKDSAKAYCPIYPFVTEGTAGNEGWTEWGGTILGVGTESCADCTKFEERYAKFYKSIKLPKVFTEENRGKKSCCCNFMILASSENDSWKNDLTSAWIKLSDSSDSATLKIKKCSLELNYVPEQKNIVKEPNAFYWTIDWNEVLQEEGEGTYSVYISYNIAGITQDILWGIYDVKQWSIKNALKTARLKAVYNSYQEIEGIDFTDTKVIDTIRFKGFIGKRQPNTQIDNLIYQNRETKKVIRENLNVYEVNTDPTCEKIITKMTDLFLLSENELYITDGNDFNHSYKYNDLPVILENTAEIKYFDFDRKASLSVKVSDKFKNNRSFFK